MTEEKQTQKISYFVTAFVHKVKINKNVTFKSKVMWKRREVKTETKITQNQGVFSVFDEQIVLPFTFIYDIRTMKLQTKNTDFYSVVVAQKGLRAGGSAKFDISQILNDGLQNKSIKIPLLKSPDPQAYIEVSFLFQKQSQIFGSQSGCSQTSIADSNSSMFLNENSISKQSNISKQNSKIESTSFLKSKTRNPLQSKQNELDLPSKIKNLQDCIKQASSTIKQRDSQIFELKATVISNIQKQLKEQRQKNSILQQQLNQSRINQSSVVQLKRQLSEAKLNIGKILNQADTIGGSKLVHKLCLSIGIVQN